MTRSIKLVQKHDNIKLTQKKPTIKLTKKAHKIVLKQVGRQGKQGIQGVPGQGLPFGGKAGDIIIKASDDNYDFDYRSPSDLADKTYTQDFTTATSVTVNHNLDKRPSVSVTDSAGDEVDVGVKHVNTSQLVISWKYPFSGRVTCN